MDLFTFLWIGLIALAIVGSYAVNWLVLHPRTRLGVLYDRIGHNRVALITLAAVLSALFGLFFAAAPGGRLFEDNDAARGAFFGLMCFCAGVWGGLHARRREQVAARDDTRPRDHE